MIQMTLYIIFIIKMLLQQPQHSSTATLSYLDSQLSPFSISYPEKTIQQMLQNITDRQIQMVSHKQEIITVQPIQQTLERPLPQVELVEEQEKVSFGLYLLFCYLYFIQGFMLGIIGTIPYVYPELPDVDTMIIFNNLSIPYSFKFLIAPLLQKFTSISYGKRKTWIMLSEFTTAIFLFVASFFTAFTHAKTFAVLCFFIQIFMVIQNIALHALIVKEIRSAHQSSLIQSFAQVLGILFGSLILLKLTSKEFSHSIGLQHEITSPQVVLITVVFIILVPLIAIHFKLRQRTLESEVRGSQFSFCKIIKKFNVFFQLKSKYYRFCIFIVIYNQGLNFFASLYDYQLVKAGFSKNTSNTIGNLVIIPTLLLTFFFKSWTERLKGTRNAIMVSTSLSIVISLYVCLVFPVDIPSIAIISFLLSLFDGWRFYNFGVLINQFPIHALTGMYLTVFGSYFNFGRLTFIHGQLCKWFGWKQMSIIGLGIQVMIIIFTPTMYNWVLKGDLTLSKDIQQKQQNQQHQSNYKEMA